MIASNLLMSRANLLVEFIFTISIVKDKRDRAIELGEVLKHYLHSKLCLAVFVREVLHYRFEIFIQSSANLPSFSSTILQFSFDLRYPRLDLFHNDSPLIASTSSLHLVLDTRVTEERLTWFLRVDEGHLLPAALQKCSTQTAESNAAITWDKQTHKHIDKEYKCTIQQPTIPPLTYLSKAIRVLFAGTTRRILLFVEENPWSDQTQGPSQTKESDRHTQASEQERTEQGIPTCFDRAARLRICIRVGDRSYGSWGKGSPICLPSLLWIKWDDRDLFVTKVVIISESRDWHHASREGLLLCTDCRLYFKKYGQLRPVDRPSTVPQCLFKRSPSGEEEESGVRTRAGKKERKR